MTGTNQTEQPKQAEEPVKELSPQEKLAQELGNSYLTALLEAVPALEAATIHFAWSDGFDADGCLKARDNQLTLNSTVKLADASLKLVEFTNRLLAGAVQNQMRAAQEAQAAAESQPQIPEQTEPVEPDPPEPNSS